MITTFNVHYTEDGTDKVMAVDAKNPDAARNVVMANYKGLPVRVIISKVKVDRTKQ